MDHSPFHRPISPPSPHSPIIIPVLPSSHHLPFYPIHQIPYSYPRGRQGIEDYFGIASVYGRRTTGVSPAHLMLGRNVRTRLDLLCPRKDVPKHVAPAPSAANLAQNVSRSQTSQSKYFGGKKKINFTVGDKVIVKWHYQNVRAHKLTQYLKKNVDQLLHWRGGDDTFIQDTLQAAYEHYNSDELVNDYTFVKMQSNADDRARQTEIEITTTRGADRADERQSAEDYGEELNISKNDSNTTSSSPEGGEVGGDTMTRGYGSTEAENEMRTRTPRAPTRSGHRRRTTARDCPLRHQK
ncbi:hypothetical protein EVAR_13909_1 [Eumeta japonica]|uniref:Uncharacterized protein n=1 Tax=Eumeta variegata TaxID=151549 RepID=A0A4C1U8I6_EUMVA|nr:hypothetical protein EVAR_13909_1 [Eumeta japonica]